MVVRDHKTIINLNDRQTVDKVTLNLFQMMTSYESDTGLKHLLEAFNFFFTETFGVKDCFIYSVKDDDLNRTHKKTSYIRSLWKREESTAFLLDEKTNQELQDVLMARISRDELKGNTFINFGHLEGQYIFAYFPLKVEMDAQLLKFLEVFLGQKLKMITRWREAHRLESLIYIDDVTGLFNQRKLVLDINAAVKRFQDIGEHFSVLFIDLDHFKLVNDGHGHLIGTQLLSDTAQVLMSQLRDTDLCYRYGGDEFVMLVPEANAEIALSIGRRVLEKITNHHFVIDESQLFSSSHPSKIEKKIHEFKLSVSVGVACFPDHASTEHDILALADKMMYQAKQSGRGQVCFAGDMFKKEA